MQRPTLPRANSKLVLPDGRATPDFHTFLDRLAGVLVETGVVELGAGAVAALLDRLAAIEDASRLTIAGPLSVRVQGTAEGGAVRLSLLGDSEAPGNTYYYGTGPTGEKAWFTIASAFTGAADQIELTTEADGVTEIGLADLADAGGGTLRKIVRDTKGRVSGSSDATTDDLTEGATNLYFTDARARAAVITASITNGDTTHSPSGDAVFDALAGKEPTISAGTTAQFLNGLKVATDTLLGTFNVTLDGSGTGFIGSRFAADAAGFQFRVIRGRGTLSSPGALLSGDAVFTYQGRAYYDNAGTPTVSGNLGDVQLEAVNNLSATDRGTALVVRTTTIGGTTLVERLRVSSAGVVIAAPLVLNAVLTPAQITANQNDYAPTNHATAYHFRLSTDASRTITSMAGGVDGLERLITNVGAQDLVLEHASASGTAANRLLCPGSVNVTLNPNDSVRLRYDGTSSRWRVLGF